jgi:hypothetical protein
MQTIQLEMSQILESKGLTAERRAELELEYTKELKAKDFDSGRKEMVAEVHSKHLDIVRNLVLVKEGDLSSDKLKTETQKLFGENADLEGQEE